MFLVCLDCNWEFLWIRENLDNWEGSLIDREILSWILPKSEYLDIDIRDIGIQYWKLDSTGCTGDILEIIIEDSIIFFDRNEHFPWLNRCFEGESCSISHRENGCICREICYRIVSFIPIWFVFTTWYIRKYAGCESDIIGTCICSTNLIFTSCGREKCICNSSLWVGDNWLFWYRCLFDTSFIIEYSIDSFFFYIFPISLDENESYSFSYNSFGVVIKDYSIEFYSFFTTIPIWRINSNIRICRMENLTYTLIHCFFCIWINNLERIGIDFFSCCFSCTIFIPKTTIPLCIEYTCPIWVHRIIEFAWSPIETIHISRSLWESIITIFLWIKIVALWENRVLVWSHAKSSTKIIFCMSLDINTLTYHRIRLWCFYRYLEDRLLVCLDKEFSIIIYLCHWSVTSWTIELECISTKRGWIRKRKLSMKIRILINCNFHLSNDWFSWNRSLTSDNLDGSFLCFWWAISIKMKTTENSLEIYRICELIEWSIWIDIEIISSHGIHSRNILEVIVRSLILIQIENSEIVIILGNKNNKFYIRICNFIDLLLSIPYNWKFFNFFITSLSTIIIYPMIRIESKIGWKWFSIITRRKKESMIFCVFECKR